MYPQIKCVGYIRLSLHIYVSGSSSCVVRVMNQIAANIQSSRACFNARASMGVCLGLI